MEKLLVVYPEETMIPALSLLYDTRGFQGSFQAVLVGEGINGAISMSKDAVCARNRRKRSINQAGRI